MSNTKAQRFRIMATECERQARLAESGGDDEFHEIQKRLANSYHALAQNEDWLDGRAEEFAKVPSVASDAYEAA